MAHRAAFRVLGAALLPATAPPAVYGEPHRELPRQGNDQGQRCATLVCFFSPGHHVQHHSGANLELGRDGIFPRHSGGVQI